MTSGRPDHHPNERSGCRRAVRRFSGQTVDVQRVPALGVIGTVGVAGLVALAACSSDADQTAVPPPSPDATDETDAPDTVPPTTLASTATADVVDTLPTEVTAPPSTSTVPPSTTASTVPPSTSTVPSRPTIDELLASGDVLNIAHAGGDQEWPHSTFYAFDRAVAAGADVLEIDVQLTGDGILIVHHDDTVDKTTEGTGRVDSYTFGEIAALDAGYWFADGCWPCRDLSEEEYLYRGVRTGDVPPPAGARPDDFRIISFAEFADRYPDQAFDVEIKGVAEAAEATAEALASEIDELDLTDNVVVVSFDDATIEHFRSVAPGVDVSPGIGALSAWLLEGVPLDSAYRIVQVPPMFGDVPVITPEFWAAVDAAGVSVWVWPDDAATQENTAFYQQMIDQGATGIIAGRPTAFPG